MGFEAAIRKTLELFQGPVPGLAGIFKCKLSVSSTC